MTQPNQPQQTALKANTAVQSARPQSEKKKSANTVKADTGLTQHTKSVRNANGEHIQKAEHPPATPVINTASVHRLLTKKNVTGNVHIIPPTMAVTVVDIVKLESSHI